MIKHPENRYERRKLKELYEKKKPQGRRAKEALRDEETQDELRSYRSGELSTD